ncbi:MAG: 6-phosphogluconate dehydrogenase [Parasphingorhabdus sp.]|jgi:6-phosphogluconate dehydrogenase
MPCKFDPKLHSHIGLIGMGVMGSNLAQRIISKGFQLQIYDRDEELLASASNILGSNVPAFSHITDLVASLARPRCLILLIKAGSPIDQVLQQLLSLLDEDDLVVDLGNSFYKDTERRIETSREAGVSFIGCGISGGAEGARNGPALMPGGEFKAWPAIADLFCSIAAQHNGEACSDWVGPGGSGHFVKMVHNGIEYADMQLIAETYHLMRDSLNMDCRTIARQFSDWNAGLLRSYLMEISANILTLEDNDGTPAVDLILDRAGQKGTGSWTSEAALEYGIPANLLAEAVFARVISSFKEKRVRLTVAKEKAKTIESSTLTQEEIERALYAARVIAYCQGLDLIDAASNHNNWQLNLSRIAAGWRAGCIIRGQLLEDIVVACDDGCADGLLSTQHFSGQLSEHVAALRKLVVHAVQCGIPVAGFSAALAFYDAYHTARLPANLIQAQRDYFGAHGFQSTDGESENLFHIDWTASTAKLVKH